jgi:hypothetical protein
MPNCHWQLETTGRSEYAELLAYLHPFVFYETATD